MEIIPKNKLKKITNDPTLTVLNKSAKCVKGKCSFSWPIIKSKADRYNKGDINFDKSNPLTCTMKIMNGGKNETLNTSPKDASKPSINGKSATIKPLIIVTVSLA